VQGVSDDILRPRFIPDKDQKTLRQGTVSQTVRRLEEGVALFSVVVRVK
jgi:hypothetical protein